MKIKNLHFDFLIISLLCAVLLVDTLTGYLKLSASAFSFPFSQLYKVSILFLIVLRLHKKAAYLLGFLVIFTLLLLPTFFQLVQGSYTDFYADSLKITKYLTPYIAFVYFKEIFREDKKQIIKYAFLFVRISFIIVVANVLLKFVGEGYPLYSTGIGSKGFIYAGNEISTLFLIIYAILAYNMLLGKKSLRFFFFFLFTINISFVLGSKSAIAGIFLITMMIWIRPLRILASSRKLGNFIVVGTFLIPLGLFFLVKKFVSSELFQNRIMYFYERMDLLTLILSSRNVFFEKAYETYLEEYNIVEKYIGVGQSAYEYVTEKNIEMEFLDIFFTYGFLGLLLFLAIIFLVYRFLSVRKNIAQYPFARLAYLSFLLLVVISSLAGHVFSSGIASIFIGFIIATTYLKRTV